ncbi:hypothetical protein HRbin01_01739 [archaeon HR01]|nr:hypothetical protein HRbin01_01739 [archaeon HR01]
MFLAVFSVVGVWHISGLGASPGAVTTPLTVVYLLMKAAQLGSEEAAGFFLGSGQAEDGVWAGAPEAIVLLSSSEVIEGVRRADRVEDRLFNLSSRDGRVPEIIWKYLSRLYRELWESGLGVEIYLLATGIDDVDRVVRDAVVTVSALKGKEVWVNMVAGPNTVNLSLLISSVILGAASRYYYIFQPKTQMLHPENVTFESLRNPGGVVGGLINLWVDIPIFQMELEPLLRRLREVYDVSPFINRAELKRICDEYNVGLEKLKRLISFDGDRTSPSPLFRSYLGILKHLEDAPRNFSEWREWGRRERILYTLDRETGRVRKLW